MLRTDKIDRLRLKERSGKKETDLLDGVQRTTNVTKVGFQDSGDHLRPFFYYVLREVFTDSTVLLGTCLYGNVQTETGLRREKVERRDKGTT